MEYKEITSFDGIRVGDKFISRYKYDKNHSRR